MKLVILVRHATAVDRDIDSPDFDRTLVKKGKKESAKMAKIFKSYQIKIFNNFNIYNNIIFKINLRFLRS